MRIIITGATSFIATEFTKLAVECGNDVYAVCRNIKKARARFREDASLHFVEASMNEYKSIGSRIPKADVFVHFAWDGTKIEERDIEDVHSRNINYTMEAIATAKSLGCKLFVDTGSQAEYGLINTTITEETPCNPFSEYGKAKLAVYKKGTEYSKKVGIKYLHLRIFSVYGENDHSHTLVMSGLQKLLKNEPLQLSDCNQNWNFLYIRDAVQQIYRLMEVINDDESFESGVYNIASSDTRILKDFVLEMKAITNSKSELRFGETQPKQVVSLDPDISKTFGRIGFTSNYSFETGIKRILDAMNTTWQVNTGTTGGGMHTLRKTSDGKSFN